MSGQRQPGSKQDSLGSEPHCAEPEEKLRKKSKDSLPPVSRLPLEEIQDGIRVFLRDPVNDALVLWLLLAGPACIGSIAISLGLVDKLLPDIEARERVDETCIQLVNALFFLTSLIGLPLLCRHGFLLYRWRSLDQLELRRAYCKNGKRKPNDRLHLSAVVFWGQLACWTTFLYAAIHWVWPRAARPTTAINIVNAIAKVASAASFLHLLLSPLSHDYDVILETDEQVSKMLRKSSTFFQKRRQVKEPAWDGTIVPGCCSDKKVAVLTCLLPCCMFGYNMERLGFGHRVVHTMAFLIVLFGPLLVFTMSAGSLKHHQSTEKFIHNSGLILTLCGLAYGGLWRIKMRETFNLPGNSACCGSQRLTDVCTWMFCSYCALCQELRTADQYDVEQQSFYKLASFREPREAQLQTEALMPHPKPER